MADLIDAFLSSLRDVAEPVTEHLFGLLVVVLSSGAALGILAVLVYGVWAAISVGLRQEERARCFIRLLEIGLRLGQTIEETIRSMAQARVREMGIYFHLLAAWMERGLRLGPALEEVPRFLPPQVAAMLRVGESIGDVAAVLPACRQTLTSGASEARKRTNNIVVLFFVSPIGPAVIAILSVWVMPKFEDIARDMGVPFDRALSVWFDVSLTIGIVTAFLWLLLWLVEVGKCGGQWLVRAILPPSHLMLDRLNLFLPWKRKRLQRDFSVMLSSMLDSGVPEDRAIQLAAEATANSILVRRAEAALVRLKEGAGLADAMQGMEKTGEFRWRLRNAGASGQGFSVALRGWNEALDARAFQQEQFYSQLMSAGFVMLNGLMVGLATVGVFDFLVTTLDFVSW